MTVRQIIQEIEALPAEEQSEIRAFLSSCEKGPEKIRYIDPKVAIAMADKIFTDHAELFKKLAE